ncbi:fatty acid desaturase [Massilia genomosp. 1]|uniref:Fatty acid desaturase n=1 Tax=Massilia genomosp. 1 TaxID=2609280 RepID=A0ABX0MPB5_9BURK|nr:fatty acid desaturase [Massilia genomosp. 1]NHZ62323.1 fatty acid desaturase [Massilia genomosp. 1]
MSAFATAPASFATSITFPSLTRRNAGMPQLGSLDDHLLTVAAWQRIVLAALPVLTLAAFSALYAQGLYLALPVVMLMHFVVTVAYLHDVAHGSAGLDARVTHVVLFIVSVLVLQSGHSFRYTHLHHHAHCLEEDDLEGAPARASLLGALLAGPLYLPRLWRESLRKIRPARERRWMVAELATSLALVLLALWLTRWTTGPLLYCAMAWAGGWFYPLATAYLPHYKPGSKPLEQARTMRGAIVPALFMNLTYHLEHHLYPQVPTLNLRRLSRRLDPHFAACGLHPTQVY